jgi:hypothetical protein
MRMNKAAAPMPIPALAPVDKPELEDVDAGVDVDELLLAADDEADASDVDGEASKPSTLLSDSPSSGTVFAALLHVRKLTV